MKKALLSLIILTIFSVSAAHSQDMVSLDTAIKQAADYFDKRLKANSTVAVLNIKSDDQAMSNYIIDELTGAIVNRGNLIAVERRDMDLLQKEMAFQLSGDVNDESAQAIGKKLGAQTIISGGISPAKGKYRLGLRAISVETGIIQGIFNKDISVDSKIKTLTGGGYGESFTVSIGGGLRIGGSFTEGTRKEKGTDEFVEGAFINKYNYTITETNSRSEFDIGGLIFFDLKYAEINMGAYNGFGEFRQSWNKDYSNNKTIKDKNESSTGSSSTFLFDIGVLAKYPIVINRITLFPAVGAGYQLWLSAQEKGKRIPGDLSANNAVWLKAGGGADYRLARSLYLRGELLWGFKLDSKNEAKDSFKYFTHGPAAHVGLGYVFNQR